MGVYSGREGGDLPGAAILTLPEEVQLMLRLNSGRVAFGWVELAAFHDSALAAEGESCPLTQYSSCHSL